MSAAGGGASSSSGGGASTHAVAAGAASPPLELVLRGKESMYIQAFTAAAPVSARETPATPAPSDTLVKSGFDGSSGVSYLSPDGLLLAVTDKDCIDIFDVSTPGAPAARSRVALAGVVNVAFSPLGNLLVSWHRKRADEPNLLVWSTSDGALRAFLHHRQYAPELFPPLRWTSDQKLCARVGNDVVHLYDGEFPIDASSAGGAEPTSLQRLAAPGVTAVWVSPAPGPLFSFVTFSPAKGSKTMGAALMWSMPRLSEPVASRSLQADGASVKFAPDGHAALIELTQVASDEHYDGDSRLFLLSRDGATNVAIMPPKDGSVHDFAWSPRSDFFIVIAGKSPPAATLYSRKAVATFSFGAAAHNTIRISPNAHVVMLGGFGNMGGTMTFWDTAKKVLLGAPTNAQCVINAEWSPDSRFLLTATLRPRLQVDNGFRVWDYHGRCVAFRACDYLYSANWRPLPATAFPPARAPSPAPAGTGSGVNGGGAPQKYVPPSMRGDSNTARLATEAMNVRYTSAGKILPGATGVAAPQAELSKGQIKKAKERAKYEAARAREEAESALKALSGGAAGGAAAASSKDECSAAAAAAAAEVAEKRSASASVAGGAAALLGTGAAKDKVVRKLQKQLRSIEALIAARERGDTLNEQQLLKLEGEGELRRKLGDLGVSDSGVADGDEANQ